MPNDREGCDNARPSRSATSYTMDDFYNDAIEEIREIHVDPAVEPPPESSDYGMVYTEEDFLEEDCAEIPFYASPIFTEPPPLRRSTNTISTCFDDNYAGLQESEGFKLGDYVEMAENYAASRKGTRGYIRYINSSDDLGIEFDIEFNDGHSLSIGSRKYCRHGFGQWVIPETVIKIAEGLGRDEFICSCCNNKGDTSKSYSTNHGKICKECKKNLYVYCRHCRKYELESAMYSGGGSKYCRKCFKNYFRICRDCGDIKYHDSILYLNGDDGCICHDCFALNYVTCHRCNIPVHTEEVIYSEERRNNYCEECYSLVDGLPEYHNSRRKFVKKCFNDEPEHSLYFGFELECEIKRDNDLSQKDIYKALLNDKTSTDFHFERDSSLRNGIEIVTNPISKKYYKKNKKRFISFFDTCIDKGLRSWHHRTCGFHIHLSKNCFSSLHLYKFLKLFYENRDFFQMIGDRPPNEYCYFDDNSLVAKAKHKDNVSSCRHSAINLENPDTIELRFFKGNLKSRVIFSYIECALSAYEFSKYTGIKDISVDNYCSYIKKNKKEYGSLNERIQNDKGEF